jgi:hypothetical protein
MPQLKGCHFYVDDSTLGIFHFFLFLESIAKTKNSRRKKKPVLSFTFTPDMSCPCVCHVRNYNACRAAADIFTEKTLLQINGPPASARTAL